MKKIYTLFILCLLSFCNSYAQPAGWSYNLPFTITENSGALVTNYQAKLTVNTQNYVGLGQMLASGNDIRFGKDCAGTTLYNYWIESGMNTATTTIWVKIDTLFPFATRTFFMFYGNSSAPAVSAIPGTFSGPMSATDSTANTSLSGVADAQRGFHFAPTEDILVTAFGKSEPSSNPKYVTLFDFSTQAVLSQQQVSGPSSQWSYQNISSPIWLNQSQQYLLEIFFPNGDDAYYFGAAPTVGQQITYYDMRYCNGCSQNTFPTNSLGGMLYGYVDMWYWTKNNVSPAPTVAAGTALASNAGPNVTYCIGGSATIGGTATGGSGTYSYSWTPTNDLSSTTTVTTIANPTVTTVYTLTVTDACGTVASSNVTVNVNPLPTIAATAVNDSICPGGNADVIVTGSSTSYVWMPGNATTATYNVSPAATTTYTVTGTDVNTCVNSTTVTLTVATPPTVSVSGTYAAICDNMNTTLTMTASGASTYSWNPGSGTGTTFTDTPISSTTYTVIGTDALGCSDTSNYSVTLLPSPMALATASDDTICAGMCITLVGTATGGTPGYSYIWSTGTTTLSFLDCPTVPTCYSFLATDANGCTDTANFCVYVNPLPNVTFSSTLNTVCVNDGASTLTGGLPAGGTYSGTGVSGSTFTPATAGTGTHTLTYFFTDNNGCSDSATHTVTVNACTGITEAVVDGNVSVYPNPFSTVMTITRVATSDVTVNLFDAQGKLVMSKKTNGNKIEIDTAGFANGIYSLQLIDESGTKTFRVTKN